MRPRRRRPAQALPHIALIDSSAFYALLDPTDANHTAARQIAQRLDTQHWQLCLTNFIRAEAHALVLNRLHHRAANRFLAELRANPSTTIIEVARADEEQALELIAKYQDKDFSLTDATSFVVMERLGIPYAFTFDDDFTQYGLTTLTPLHI